MTPLLDVRNVSVTFTTGGRVLHAVRDCSLQLNAGEVLALVGESGCGKSTLARVIAGVMRATQGSVLFETQDLRRLPRSRAPGLRRRIQMVFQDPDASLNPAHRVRTILAEPLLVRGYRDRMQVERRVSELAGLVHLDAALLARRPHELSGGQKQRVAIARALAMEPDVLIADEPLAALDVSTAASIAQLFRDLQATLRIAMLFITHDLAAVRRLATRIAVMFAGEIVETGPLTMLESPAHPYTRLLLTAVPATNGYELDMPLIQVIDAVPPVAHTIGACHYRARCLERIDICARPPLLDPVGERADHLARCHLSR